MRGKRQAKTEARGPRPIAVAIEELFSRRGYGQVQWREQLGTAWDSAVGAELAKQSRPGNLRRGVLEIVVSSSSAMQELMFGKEQLLRALQENQPRAEILDLRFRLGEIS